MKLTPISSLPLATSPPSLWLHFLRYCEASSLSTPTLTDYYSRAIHAIRSLTPDIPQTLDVWLAYISFLSRLADQPDVAFFSNSCDGTLRDVFEDLDSRGFGAFCSDSTHRFWTAWAAWEQSQGCFDKAKTLLMQGFEAVESPLAKDAINTALSQLDLCEPIDVTDTKSFDPTVIRELLNPRSSSSSASSAASASRQVSSTKDNLRAQIQCQDLEISYGVSSPKEEDTRDLANASFASNNSVSSSSSISSGSCLKAFETPALPRHVSTRFFNTTTPSTSTLQAPAQSLPVPSSNPANSSALRSIPAFKSTPSPGTIFTSTSTTYSHRKPRRLGRLGPPVRLRGAEDMESLNEQEKEERSLVEEPTFLSRRGVALGSDDIDVESASNHLSRLHVGNAVEISKTSYPIRVNEEVVAHVRDSPVRLEMTIHSIPTPNPTPPKPPIADAPTPTPTPRTIPSSLAHKENNTIKSAPSPAYIVNTAPNQVLESIPSIAPAAAPPPVQPPCQPQSFPIGKTIVINSVPYIRLSLLGRGGSSKVYKILSPTGEIHALKKVNLKGSDKITIEGYMNEIRLLKRFRDQSSTHIIKLIDSEVDLSRSWFVLVMECGEIDLAGVLHNFPIDRLPTGDGVNFVRFVWESMLKCVAAVHEEGVVHTDLKPANFLMVQGQLKLIDFGIAKAIPNDTTNIQREHQTGTCNYMSPESLMYVDNLNSQQQMLKIGRPSDVWSLGCILYQMIYGRPPFAHLQMLQKLQAIINVNYEMTFAPVSGLESAIFAMRMCLVRDPKRRAGITELLVQDFLRPEENVARLKRDLKRQAAVGSGGAGSGSVVNETTSEPNTAENSENIAQVNAGISSKMNVGNRGGVGIGVRPALPLRIR